VKISAELLVMFVGFYVLGYVGIRTILSKNGLFLWDFWFGSVYSFVISDFVYVMVVERRKKYPKLLILQILRFAFFLAGIYASAEAVLFYSTTFNAFIDSQSTLHYVGYVVLGLSGGTFVVPYLYFRWKYSEKPPQFPDPLVVLEGL
jgi:hypothetical protein